MTKSLTERIIEFVRNQNFTSTDEVMTAIKDYRMNKSKIKEMATLKKR